MNTRRTPRSPWRQLQSTLARVPRWLLAVMLVSLAAALPVLATAAADDEDPPGRVGRLAQVDGEVQWYDSENGAWEAAERNRPLTSGDRLSTGPGSRAELRVGSTVLRLAAATELEVRQLDDVRMVFELHSGSLALRVRSRELAREIELVTREARLAPQRAGHYRLDRIDDSTQAGSWRGELRVLGDRTDRDEGVLDIATGEHVELWREGQQGNDPGRLAHTRTPLPQDDFAAWVQRADQADTRSASTRHVSPEMTGVEELDRHGRWDRHPEYGAIWFPRVVAADWAPYRHGRWQWTARWGWTWVDAAPWGFAPFHYGRWVHFGGRWAWAPGQYVRRPVFSPGLVAWVGGPNFGVSVQIGGGAYPGHPHVGWVPLAPHEVYRPWYRASPGHVHRIDRHHPPRQQTPPRPRPGEAGRPTIPERVIKNPQQWVNQRAPGGVTVVPREALLRRDPVQRVVVDGPARPGAAGRPWLVNETLPAQAPPARSARPPLDAVTSGPNQHGPERADRRPNLQHREDRGDREDREDRIDRFDRIDRIDSEAREPLESLERREHREGWDRRGPGDNRVERTGPWPQRQPRPQAVEPARPAAVERPMDRTSERAAPPAARVMPMPPRPMGPPSPPTSPPPGLRAPLPAAAPAAVPPPRQAPREAAPRPASPVREPVQRLERTQRPERALERATMNDR